MGFSARWMNGPRLPPGRKDRATRDPYGLTGVNCVVISWSVAGLLGSMPIST
jgi:hypothetical protein